MKTRRLSRHWLDLPLSLMGCFGEGDPPAGGGGAAPKPPEAETFSKDYVRELREENKGWRLKASEAETKKKEAEEAAAKAAKEADDKVKGATTAADQRVIRAELKAAALNAGMVDLDGLKLADMSTVKLNDAGEVEGADALMETMKKLKPYLFGAASSSTGKEPPKPGDPTKKKASEMTDAEREVAARSLGISLR